MNTLNEPFEEIVLNFILIPDLKNIVVNYLSIHNICRFLLEQESKEELTIFQCSNSDLIGKNKISKNGILFTKDSPFKDSPLNTCYFKAKNKKHGLLIYEKSLNNMIINYEMSYIREKNIRLDFSEDLLLVKKGERKVIIENDLKVFDKSKYYNFIDSLIDEIIENDKNSSAPESNYKTDIRAREKIEISKNIIEIMMYYIYDKNSNYKIHFNLLKFIDGTEEQESDISLLEDI